MPQRWLVAWFLVGASYTFVLLAALSVGPFILPVVIGATWFLTTREGSHEGRTGLVSGLGVPLLWFAHLNRSLNCVALSVVETV